MDRFRNGDGNEEMMGALGKQLRRVKEIEDCLLSSQQERARYVTEILKTQACETDYLSKVRCQIKRLEALKQKFSDIYIKATNAKDRNTVKQLILTTAVLSNKLLDSSWLNGHGLDPQAMAGYAKLTEGLEATLKRFSSRNPKPL